MIRALLLIAVVTLPNLLKAETIAVISGEHADFSRLVLQYPSEERWSISRFEEGYILGIESEKYDYDIRNVFDRIPKVRIIKLASEPDGALKIYTRTGFHLDAFDLRAGRLVIDIKDGPPPPNSLFERQNSPPNEANRQVKTNSPTNAQQASIVSAQTAANGLPSISLPSLMNIPTSQPFDDAYFAPNLAPFENQNLRVLEMEEALFGKIGRAISQGLLEADLPDRTNAIKATQQFSNTRAPSPLPDTPSLPSKPEIEDRRHVRVQTAVDRDKKQTLALNTAIGDESQCLPHNLLAIETWGEPLQDGLLLSEFRSLALGEFDQSLPQGVADLAKYYLYLSFGAEAKMVLAEFGVSTPNAAFLKILADIIDNGHSEFYDRLSDYSMCPGATGFWALLARENLEKSSSFSGPQIASYFSGLPLHLRQHLGPNLSEKLLSVGDTQTAKLIQNALSRVEGDHGDAFDLLSAEMQLSDGDITQAAKTLDSISKNDGPSAVTALVRAIDLRSSQNETIDKKTAETAEVLAIEYRGAPQEKSLIRASIVARISSGDPDLALAALATSDVQNLLTEDDQRNLINDASRKFTEKFNDLNFAKQALLLRKTGAEQYLTDETKERVAQRMLSIGFGDLASQFTKFEGTLTNSKRLLLAKIAQSTGKYQDALIYLTELNNNEAILMRAELYLLLDMPQKSADAFKLADQSSSADSANFLAENWNLLTDSKDENLAQTAKLLTQENTISPINTPISITSAQGVLQNSQLSREIFDNLVQQQ